MTTQITSPPPPRVGVLGGGFMAAVHSRAARAAGAVLVGVASSSADRAAEAAATLGIPTAYPSADALIADSTIDVVHVCTPNATHAELTRAVLAAGKHVVCEKPLALDADQAAALVTAAQESGRIAAVPFVYRYHPMVQELRARIAQGELGRVITVQGSYLQDWLLAPEAGNWRVDSAAGGRSRAFADIGSHLLDLVEFVTGDRVSSLVATTSIVHNRRGDSPVDTEDVAALTVRLEGGAVGSMLVAQTAAGHDNDLRIEVMGTAAAATFAQELPDTLTIGRPGQKTIVARGGAGLSAAAQELSIVPGGHPMGYQDAFNAFVRDVYASVRGAVNERLPTFADGARMNRVAEAVLDSAQTGTWVSASDLQPVR